MKIDLIVSWPNNCDYPLWRKQLRDDRDRYNNVIIVFTETNSLPNFTEFVKQATAKDNCTYLYNRPLNSYDDWRDVAVKQALTRVTGDWVFFTEQDFYFLHGFWYELEGLMPNYKIIGVMDDTRLHPCGLFLHKDILNKIRLDFSANPPEYDHFGYIQKQLEDLNEPIAVIPEYYYKHMAGLSHNFRLITEGLKPNYKKEEFDTWINYCLDPKIELSKDWLDIVKSYKSREK